MSLKRYVRTVARIREDVQKVEEARRLLNENSYDNEENMRAEVRTKEYDIEDRKQELLDEIEEYEVGETIDREEFQELEDMFVDNRLRRAESFLETILTR